MMFEDFVAINTQIKTVVSCMRCDLVWLIVSLKYW